MGQCESKIDLPQMTFNQYCNKIIDKYTPTEICSEEKIKEIKIQNLVKIQEFIEKEYKNNKNPLKFSFNIGKFLLIDNEEQEKIEIDSNIVNKTIYISDYPPGRCVSAKQTLKLPKLYKNSFNRIISNEDILTIVKSVIKDLFIFEEAYMTWGIYNVLFIQQPDKSDQHDQPDK